MEVDISYLFKYLKSKAINLDKSEFLFQIHSHPNYPSLLSISDTLNFFKINNLVFQLEIDKISSLPNDFIALLDEPTKNKSQLYHIAKNGELYDIYKKNNVHAINSEELKRRWKNLVLLVENNDEILFKKTRSIGKKIKVLLITLLLILSFLILLNFSLYDLAFFIIVFLGVLFSIITHRELFRIKSDFVENLCEINPNTNCSNIFNSEKWKIFKIAKFNDLSLVFFFSQLVFFLFSLINYKNIFNFYSLQIVNLYLLIPITILSAYYQKVVEKKWCPICLALIVIIYIEAILLFIIKDFSFLINLQSIIIFCFIFTFISIAWYSLKEQLMDLKFLRESHLKSNRFARNYEIFKNSLIMQDKLTTLPLKPILLGNVKAKDSIVIITNPFCGHCGDLHLIVNKILNDYKNDINIKIIFRTNFELDDEITKNVFRNLLSIYLTHGEDYFKKALLDLNEVDKILWLDKYQIKKIIKDVDNYFYKYNEWCLENKFNYTPQVFINQYHYPNAYDKDNLYFFINDLIYDEND